MAISQNCVILNDIFNTSFDIPNGPAVYNGFDQHFLPYAEQLQYSIEKQRIKSLSCGASRKRYVDHSAFSILPSLSCGFKHKDSCCHSRVQ